MTRNTVILCLTAWLMLALVPQVQANLFAGSGTEKDPYLIFSVDQLICMDIDPLVQSAYFELMADMQGLLYERGTTSFLETAG